MTLQKAFILIVLFFVFSVLDYWLYDSVVNKHGPQYQVWPGSGFYVAWKFRREP